MSTTDQTGNGEPVSTTLKAPGRADRIRLDGSRIHYYRDGAQAGMQRVPDGSFDIHLAPPPPPSTGGAPTAVVQDAVNQAQVQLMTNVAHASRATLNRIGVSFTGHLVMNVVLFVIGVTSFLVAVYKGLDNPGQADAIVAVAFGGLSVASFVTYFVSRPLDSVARAGPEAAWLLAMVNTYWTKLIYLNDPVNFPADIERAQKAFEASMKVYVETVGDHRALFAEDDVPDEENPGQDKKPKRRPGRSRRKGRAGSRVAVIDRDGALVHRAPPLDK